MLAGFYLNFSDHKISFDVHLWHQTNIQIACKSEKEEKMGKFDWWVTIPMKHDTEQKATRKSDIRILLTFDYDVIHADCNCSRWISHKTIIKSVAVYHAEEHDKVPTSNPITSSITATLINPSRAKYTQIWYTWGINLNSFKAKNIKRIRQLQATEVFILPAASKKLMEVQIS